MKGKTKIDVNIVHSINESMPDEICRADGIEWEIYLSWKGILATLRNKRAKKWIVYPEFWSDVSYPYGDINAREENINTYIERFRSAGFQVVLSEEDEGIMKGKKKITISW